MLIFSVLVYLAAYLGFILLAYQNNQTQFIDNLDYDDILLFKKIIAEYNKNDVAKLIYLAKLPTQRVIGALDKLAQLKEFNSKINKATSLVNRLNQETLLIQKEIQIHGQDLQIEEFLNRILGFKKKTEAQIANATEQDPNLSRLKKELSLQTKLEKIILNSKMQTGTLAALNEFYNTKINQAQNNLEILYTTKKEFLANKNFKETNEQTLKQTTKIKESQVLTKPKQIKHKKKRKFKRKEMQK
ncbi:hypothetical protein [Mycoplasmopsis gallopavonis]|uniref:Uncharacterized protein n=1 Tax=Mycoplasmopsis gallopavonis TaxID=76629 RepID=A0A449AZE5_9BACT|nr:hypothetical protein [Mycoplasmopsis gallopavonis]RIV16152.1 hypothetical protein D1113_03330 [Mycoplasmopsis gallopavonis]VEU72857.1 Uncharacterised protein [Mycoplasmopsis gallopavonis]